MSKTIWKYPAPMGAFRHHMPEGAEVLTVQLQHGAGQMWVLVEPDAPLKVRSFMVVGTGREHEGLDGFGYIDTYQAQDGVFVWHLFELCLTEKPNHTEPEVAETA